MNTGKYFWYIEKRGGGFIVIYTSEYYRMRKDRWTNAPNVMWVAWPGNYARSEHMYWLLHSLVQFCLWACRSIFQIEDQHSMLQPPQSWYIYKQWWKKLYSEVNFKKTGNKWSWWWSLLVGHILKWGTILTDGDDQHRNFRMFQNVRHCYFKHVHVLLAELGYWTC